jgi:nucleoside-diphosphate-sugar epimerase
MADVREALRGSDDEARAVEGAEVVLDVGAPLGGHDGAEEVASDAAAFASFVEACGAAEVRRLAFISSVAVYESAPYPWMWPIREDRPLSPHGEEGLMRFGESRIEAERLVRAYGQRAGREGVVLRTSAVWGVGAPWVAQTIAGVTARPGPSLLPGGEEVRMQWTHVQDLADGAALAVVHPGAANDVFNVAGGDLITRRQLGAALWAIEVGLAPWNAPAWTSGGDDGLLKYDIAKARERLGYVPRVSLHEGLVEVVEALKLDGAMAS